MTKQYIRMNNNDEHLSLGNLFRIIKGASKNKISALQSELFCSLFEVADVNDTTINNYCVGCRGIGGEYKQIFLNKQKKYQNKKDEFAMNIINILSIMDGVVYKDISDGIEFINNSSSASFLAQKLFNLAKNDKQVSKEVVNEYHIKLKNNNVYECLVDELIFIVLEKKQPLFEDELKKEVLENVLNDTSISSYDLQEYLSLKLREGINFDYAMKELARKGNAYANFEIGSNEYYGFVKGYPRYMEAYEYLIIAANLKHAGANYMIGNMLIRGLIGNRSNEELKRGYEFLIKSYELGNIAASNLIGNMYRDGIYPLVKDEERAISYYNDAMSHNYAYAFNNMGRIYENRNNYEKAFSYYIKSADLGESWACNKVGEWYREGVIEIDMNKAFYYYNRAIESNYRMVCNYAYYNLAKYFYKNGYDTIPVCKDENKYVEYLIISSDGGVLEALIELLDYYIIKYKKDKTNESLFANICSIKKRIEEHEKYDEDICNQVEEILIKASARNIDSVLIHELEESV